MANSLKLCKAKELFVDEHRNPNVIVLQAATEVFNIPGTANRHPNGDFEDSWTQYWLAFSEQDNIMCSECGKPLWNKECKNSEGFCKAVLRYRQVMKRSGGNCEDESMDDYMSHGSHVEFAGMTYITPLCSKHNTENVGKKIVLNKGSILVEEVDPRIDDE